MMNFQIKLKLAFILIVTNVKYSQAINISEIQFSLPGLLNLPQCGVSQRSLVESAILNGKIADEHRYPWVVSIRRYDGLSMSSHICAGSLIAEKYVVTAAHCLIGLATNRIGIAVGLKQIDDRLTESNTYNVSRITRHQSFDLNGIKNDIAIMKLSKEVALSLEVGIICLPLLDDINGKNVVAIGWGSTSGINDPTHVSNKLKETTLKVINGDEVCHVSGYDSDRVYCALDSVSHSNLCYGDSGGALQYFSNGKWYLYGIASFIVIDKERKCRPEMPSYYTRLPVFMNWIIENFNASELETNEFIELIRSSSSLNYSVKYSIWIVLFSILFNCF